MNLETPPDPADLFSRHSRARSTAARPVFGLLLAAALALTACGRAGPLEPPPEPNAVAAPADSDPTHLQGRHKPPPITPPNASFILDPLL